jgi:protein disulfide-isomerase A6
MMRLAALFPALLALHLFSPTALAADAAPEFSSENVIIATPASFDAVVAKGHSLVLFYAPWCGHCKAIKPAWSKVADLFADEPNVNVVSVDADEHRKLGERFEVTGFPTLKYIRPGGKEVEEYAGGRDEKDLVAFLNGKAGTDVELDGGVGKKGGLVPEVHEVLAGFGKASKEEQAEKISAAQKAVTGDEVKAKFAVYSKVARKIIENGVDWVAKEKGRISKLISNGKGSLTSAQKKSFQVKLNVLTAFDEL